MLSFKKLEKPKKRGFYAWNSLRAGDFLIYSNTTSNYHEFIYIPGGDYFRLTEKDFDKLLTTNQLTFVEQLPKIIYDETLIWIQKNVELSSKQNETFVDE